MFSGIFIKYQPENSWFLDCGINGISFRKFAFLTETKPFLLFIFE